MIEIVDELQLMAGIDIPVPDLGLTFHQPRVKEIAILGETNYFTALSIFSLDRETLKITDQKVTDWVLFQETLNQKIADIKNTRVFLRNFVQLFFSSKVNFGPRSIMIEQGPELVNIEEGNYVLFRDIIKQIGGSSLLKPHEETFKPGNARAAEIAEKMKKARARLAAMKPQSKSKGFLKKYIKAVAIGTSNSLEEILDMTLLQLNEVMQTYMAWEAYDIDIKSRLAGAKNDNKVVHWIMKEDSDDSGIGTI